MDLRLPKSFRTTKRRGNTAVMAMVLLITLLAIGVIVGGVSLRNQIVQEFGDAAVALDNLDQSYSYSIDIDTNLNGDFTDDGPIQCFAEYIDPAPTLMDPAASDANDPSDGAPAGIMFIPVDPNNPQEAGVPMPSGTLP
ncbi:hypothetical protein [Bremerella alba]|uniref:Uncharacterized protein n=1 Tax=Bremerella alba TaxID=980252 RepID=A0A7V8VAC8_9BACT|nr:hypothetical protein [Bremerella alba]MBA2117888.1 hypothetical protein [Bremerella alba]